MTMECRCEERGDDAISGPMSTVDAAIPILDLGPYLAGVPGADLRLAAELRRACETVGFYFITDHGVPQTDTMIECLPTCQAPRNPPKFPPQTYGEFYAWFIARNYAHQQDAAK